MTPRALRLLEAAAFTSSFDRFVIAPMLAAIAVGTGSTLTAAAQVASVYFLAYGLMQAVWGPVSERLGRRRTLRLSLALAAAGGLGAALSTGLEMLTLSRALTGAAFAAAVPGGIVYVGDTTPFEQRQRPLTRLMTAAAVGLALASVLGAAAAEYLHWRAAFAVTAVTAAVLAYALRTLPEPGDLPRQRKGALKAIATVLGDRWALLVLVLVFVEGMVLLGAVTFLPIALIANGVPDTAAGLISAAYGIAVLLSAGLVRRASRRMSAAALIATGTTCGLAATALLAYSQGVAAVLIGGALLGAAWAFVHSTLQTWITDVVPHARATAVGLFAGALFVGSAAATAAGSLLAAGGDYRTLFTAAAALLAPMGLAAVLGRRRYGGSRSGG
ncbi:hypothetical protein Ssi02_30470 [Sinosporangium siamense]|uniref:Major facilitator superfamily (MFS) profile domain-containing protein n=1 Tax=Sinosporangium siamense TaxID=1367973 RepID=A0A919RIW4_9ACTN|nr:hypothetical protein Ssi02_30470 [Sinosporangium siamense]